MSLVSGIAVSVYVHIVCVWLSIDCVTFSTCCWCRVLLYPYMYLLLVFGSALTVLHVVLVAGARIRIDCVTCSNCCWCIGSALTMLHVVLVAGVRISIDCVT